MAFVERTQSLGPSLKTTDTLTASLSSRSPHEVVVKNRLELIASSTKYRSPSIIIITVLVFVW